MRKSIIVRWFVLALMVSLVSSVAVGQSKLSQEQIRRIRDHAEPMAEQGNATAQYNMGVIYDEGHGGKPDYAKAREWYQKAADQGYAKAEHNLAILYQKGRGVAKDPAKAAHWFKRAAEHGEPAAQNNLAVLYVRGEGVPQDMNKAAAWGARAAKAGNKSALNNMPYIMGDLPQRRIDADGVNIRSRPNAEGDVLRQADRDTRVVVLGHDSDWTKILFPRAYDTGWVADGLLADIETSKPDAVSAEDESEPAKPAAVAPKSGKQPVEEQKAAAQKPAEQPAEASVDNDASATAGTEKPTRYIDSAVVNIRRRSTTNSDVIFQVHRDEKVTVLDSRNGWRRVRFGDGREGWVAGFLLRK